MKQAVIAPSMLCLLYPLDGEIEGYSREQFLADLVDECEKDIRKCFEGCLSPQDLYTFSGANWYIGYSWCSEGLC